MVLILAYMIYICIDGILSGFTLLLFPRERGIGEALRIDHVM